MSQQATDHPPLHVPELSLGDQILIRLDEIIGLLDRIATELEGGLPLLWPDDLVEAVDADDLDNRLFVHDWAPDAEDRLH
jgi:hypothetical protein